MSASARCQDIINAMTLFTVAKEVFTEDKLATKKQQ